MKLSPREQTVASPLWFSAFLCSPRYSSVCSLCSLLGIFHKGLSDKKRRRQRKRLLSLSLSFIIQPRFRDGAADDYCVAGQLRFLPHQACRYCSIIRFSSTALSMRLDRWILSSGLYRRRLSCLGRVTLQICSTLPCRQISGLPSLQSHAYFLAFFHSVYFSFIRSLHRGLMTCVLGSYFLISRSFFISPYAGRDAPQHIGS